MHVTVERPITSYAGGDVVLEVLIMVALLAVLGLAAWRFGADSRPGINDEPHRLI
ncbi:MAG TPA: hypothetical protein VMM85_01900 [Methylomirabilota bacterium]|nr:hypothetical protein [Methylomirabilota bacterium]